MKRIYEPLAYGEVPVSNSFWPTTIEQAVPASPALAASVSCDVAIIGGGFTGLFAALRLAERSVDVVLIDAQYPGWGASGRNGGLVSVGGSKLDDNAIEKRFGATDARTYYDAERAAVELVEETIERLALDVDRHSKGYSFVAHRQKAVEDVKAYGAQYKNRYGLDYEFLDKEAMIAQGMDSPDFCAGANLPIGFALNPMKFVLGVTDAVKQAGVRMYHNTPVTAIQKKSHYELTCPGGVVRAGKLIVATNGYSSDDLPSPFAGRYLPVQSNILVSRPMSEEEIAAQGWFSGQMVVDTRTLLHYFRLLPDRRMLLGLRGSVSATHANMECTRNKARQDFDRMFPAWRDVETPYFWSGLICMSRKLTPFAGALPGMENAFAALAYHGNGVTMAPYCGTLVADMAMGESRLPHADLMKAPMARFEFGRWRRASLPLAFSWYRLKDSL